MFMNTMPPQGGQPETNGGYMQQNYGFHMNAPDKIPSFTPSNGIQMQNRDSDM